MSERPSRRGFAARPADPDQWIKAAETPSSTRSGNDFTARLTIDVTPELRGQIKVAAFQRGITVAEMLRDLFAREFPHQSGEQS